MNRTTGKITAGLVATLIVMSMAPTASVGYVDLRSPDASDAARAAETRDYTDLRSPDARDAGRSASNPSPSRATSSESSGFDQDMAAVVVAGVLIVLALSRTALVTRRRGKTRRSRTRVVSS